MFRPQTRTIIKWFARFAKREGISDPMLLEAIARADQGQVDADLGSGVIKQRVARPGAGRSGGYRTVRFFRRGDRAVFVYGYAKSAKATLDVEEEKAFRKAAALVLRLTHEQLAALIGSGEFFEVHTS